MDVPAPATRAIVQVWPVYLRERARGRWLIAQSKTPRTRRPSSVPTSGHVVQTWSYTYSPFRFHPEVVRFRAANSHCTPSWLPEPSLTALNRTESGRTSTILREFICPGVLRKSPSRRRTWRTLSQNAPGMLRYQSPIFGACSIESWPG